MMRQFSSKLEVRDLKPAQEEGTGHGHQDPKYHERQNVKKGKAPAPPQCFPRAVVVPIDPLPVDEGRANGIWEDVRLGRLIGLALAAPALGQTVVDGDTIKLNGTTYRIWGIDAAETKQACADGWVAGQEASKAMLELVSGRKVTCEPRVTDRYGRTVALRRSHGRDLGASMVSAGMAWASRRTAPTTCSRSGRRSAPASGCMRTTAKSLGAGGRGIGVTDRAWGG
jgi:hypothetical protein